MSTNRTTNPFELRDGTPNWNTQSDPFAQPRNSGRFGASLDDPFADRSRPSNEYMPPPGPLVGFPTRISQQHHPTHDSQRQTDLLLEQAACTRHHQAPPPKEVPALPRSDEVDAAIANADEEEQRKKRGPRRFFPIPNYYVPPARYARNDVRTILFGKRLHGVALFTVLVTVLQCAIFLVEIIRMGVYTHNIFQTQPYFNPMLGPSTYVEIRMGARYSPCMMDVPHFTDDLSISWPCPNSTTTDTEVCSLSELCGLGTLHANSQGEYHPNQWYRMVTAIFIHGGFIHIIFNLMLQLSVGSAVELYVGTLRYAVIYLACGIGGFLLGSNFTPLGVASMGASGALFGSCISTNLLLLLMNQNGEHYGVNFRRRRSFYWYLGGSIFEVLLMLFLGLLPGLDNFSHIGGCVLGLALGVVLLNDPKFVYRPEYANTANGDAPFMEKRYPLRFAAWCFVRAVMFVLVILYFVLLGMNYSRKGASASQSCSWCRYLNCLPVRGWCDAGNLSITNN